MISDDLKVTSEILWKGAFIFALIDIVLVTILSRVIKPDDLSRMKWRLVIFMAFFFFLRSDQ